MKATIASIAPQQRLIFVAVIALFSTALSVGYLLSVPLLGITWESDTTEDQLVVASVSTDSPNTGRISPGERVMAVETSDGNRIPLFADTIHEDPDVLTYQRYNAILEQHTQIKHELENGTIRVITQDYRVIELQADDSVNTKAIRYLLINAGYGWIALLVAAGIWAYNPDRTETRLFFLSGIGLFYTTLTLGTYGGRELAISGNVLAFLMSLNHLAVLQACAALTALFWVYPVRSRRSKAHYLILGIAILAWLADQIQLSPSAQYTIYSVVVADFVLGTIVIARQWYLTRALPLERASLKWCGSAIFISCMFLMSLIMLPPALGFERKVPLYLSLIPIPLLYLGIAAGLTRYRLFDLEQWWFKTWVWFFGGALVVFLDLILIFGLGLAGEVALTLSLALAGWLYFPIRQALMRKLGRSRQHNFDLALKKLVDNLFSANSGGRIIAAWPDLLEQTFTPLSIRYIDQKLEDTVAAVSKDGVQLTLAPLEVGQPSLLLEFADEGRRLFTPADLRIAHWLIVMSKQALSTVRAREEGAEAERSRIMRDLHDDVGGKILSVLHNANDERQAQLARNALQSLRDTLQALDQEAMSWLEDCIADWRDLCEQRCEEMGAPLNWSASGNFDNEKVISVRQRINFTRILSEGLTNACKHAKPNTIDVNIKFDTKRLSLQISNDGVRKTQSGNNHIARRGLNNMRTRAEELGGSFQFNNHGSVATLTAIIPFDESQPGR